MRAEGEKANTGSLPLNSHEPCSFTSPSLPTMMVCRTTDLGAMEPADDALKPLKL